MERALARATALCAKAPTALALTKQLLADLGGPDLTDALARAIEVNVAARASPELREGVRAFLEKRSPRWTGTSDSEGDP
jgi:enoyl-CoA hydratase/carnithine racemase